MAILSSIWSFFSLVLIAWITQRIITYREKLKTISEAKLGVYMVWMPFLAECYVRAQEHEPFSDNKQFLSKTMEILGTLQIMGPLEAMEAFINFCNEAKLGFANDGAFDPERLHKSFTALNGTFCCEIHGEKQ